MVIVGIAGGIGHGKTTLAEALRTVEPNSLYIESSSLIAEVVTAWQKRTKAIPHPDEIDEIRKWLERLPGALKKITRQSFDENALLFDDIDCEIHPALYQKLFEYVKLLNENPNLLTSEITAENKSEYRAILQWLGGYVQVRLQRGFWFLELIDRLNQNKQKGVNLGILGGVRYAADAGVIKKSGGKVILIERPRFKYIDKNDPTEIARSKIIPDIKVFNDAGLSELQLCASRIYLDLVNGVIEKSYKAADFKK